MGDPRTYRWERRHKRRKRLGALAGERKSLYVFQLILLTIIFFLFLIGNRLLPIFAFVISPCVEAMSYSDATTGGASLFRGFLILTGLTLLFWGAVTLAHLRPLKQLWQAAMQGIIFMCLLWNAVLFHMITASDMTPPDGFLETNTYLVEWTGDHFPKPQFELRSDNSIMHQGGPPEGYFSYEPWSVQCVWRDRAIITTDRVYDSLPELDPYDHAITRIRYAEVADLSALATYRIALTSILSGETLLEQLRNQQHYRTMTAEEITNFDLKMECLTQYPMRQNVMDCHFVRSFKNFDTYTIKNPTR